MYYNLHTHSFSDNAEVTEIVNIYPNQQVDAPFFSTGIHPWYIDESRVNEYLSVIELRLQEKNCLALGECGLDKRIETPLKVQAAVFEKQLLLAKKYNKPVILHLVAAFQEVIEICSAVKPGVPLIIHGFSKNIQVARQMTDNGFYLSFGKYLLKNPELSAVLADVPDDRFFLETDTENQHIELVYQKAAKAKNKSIEEIKEIVSNNFKTVFKNGAVDGKSRTFV